MENQTKNRLYFHFVVFCSLAVMALLGLVNYVVDPIGAFQTDFLRPFSPNDRITHAREFKETEGVDSLLLGSSRIGALFPSVIEKYLPGSRFFNFSVSNGGPRDYWLFLNFALSRGCELKNVYMQLDPKDIRYAITEGNPETAHLPEVSGETGAFAFYLQNLFSFFPARTLAKVENQIAGGPAPEIRRERGAYVIVPDLEEALRDPEAHVKNTPAFHKKRIRYVQGVTAAESLGYVEKIAALCREKNISLTVVVYPANAHYLDEICLEDFCEYLGGLAKLTGFWNFSGYNSVTTDDRMYFEASHCLPSVHDLVLARVFNDVSVRVPEDFGSYVDSSNVADLQAEIIRSGAARDARRAD